MVYIYIGNPKNYEADTLREFDNSNKFLGMYDVKDLKENDIIYVFTTSQYIDDFEKNISKYLKLATILTKNEFLSKVQK